MAANPFNAGAGPDQADRAYEYTVVDRDTVPAPSPHPDDSPEKRMADLLRWLQPTDFLSPGNEFMKHLHSYVPGTGRWVHESAPFRAWAGLSSGQDHDGPLEPSSPHRCLHVRGVAGSGKSVFAASTVRQLQDEGALVLFFFFRQIVDKNHTARYLVRDFAAQLLPHCPALVVALTELSQEHCVRGNELGLLWPALVNALATGGVGGKPLFCVVDALDEMDDDELEDVTEKLVALSTTALGGNGGCGADGVAEVRIMMTSRPLPHIERVLAHPDVVRLKLDTVLLSPDVARYVDARMATLDPPLSDEKNGLVRHAICERANGLFLQARLMTDNLAEGLRDGRVTAETLPDSLDRLPRTLRAVYEDMLKEHARRSGVAAAQQAMILTCVTHATRPLRLIELGSLLSRMLHVDLRRGKELVRAGCGRLLELLEDETVSVIHHSFTEFLHDASRKHDDGAFPVIGGQSSHAVLAVLLLEYLDACPRVDAAIDDTISLENRCDRNFPDKENVRRDKIRTEMRISHPLASYAADNLFPHIGKTVPGPGAGELLAALDRYMLTRTAAFETWMFLKWPGLLSASVNVFHLIAGVADGELIPPYVMDHLAERAPELLDTRDADGLTPLAYAARDGHDGVVGLLLAKGADPTTGGSDGLTPLHRAASEGRAGAVRVLLDAGVDPLIKTYPVLSVYDEYEQWHNEYTEEEAEARRQSALSLAYEGRDQEVMKTFMPFIPPDEINLCFHQANDVENVSQLLEAGKADVDSFMDGKTKLYRAVRKLDLDMIKLLLHHGADVNKRCDNDCFQCYDGVIARELPSPARERGPTPLHGFAGFGLDRRPLYKDNKEKAAECLRLLIEAGADVNATADEEGFNAAKDLTPLHYAVQRKERLGFGGMSKWDKSEQILTELLLSAGANPNPKTANGNAPVHLANPEKHRVLELLVEHGADINAVNIRGRTALLEMIARLHGDSYDMPQPSVNVFDRLLELGADVNATDGAGNTIFHHILHGFAHFSKHDLMPFVKKLLLVGADLNTKNKKGEPPLWRYRVCDREGINRADDEAALRVLVEAGMDLNSRDALGHTILWNLLDRYGVETTVLDKFIRLGADPGLLSHDGETLLHAAIRSKPLANWLRYLISVGVRPDVLTQDGNTLVHRAVRGSDSNKNDLREMIQIVLDAGVDPRAKNSKGQSALHVAGGLVGLQTALSHPSFEGLDVDEPDVDGLTPLHNALKIGEQAVSSLLRAGADPTRLAASGLSLLHSASREGKAGVVGLLLARYRQLGVLDEQVMLFGEGRAPLHYACQSGNPDAVWDLLRNGADPLVTDEKGLTALHILAEYQHPAGSRYANPPPVADIVDMLQRAGVSLDAEAAIRKDDNSAPANLTPLDVAVERGSWELARELMARGVQPRDHYIQSEAFELATDKKKAAEETRKAQLARGPLGRRTSKEERVRGSPVWRGRWAACQGALTTPPKENADEVYFVASGQDILDAKARESDESKDSRDKIVAVDVLEHLLRDGDYDTIKEYAELGGDLYGPEPERHWTFLHRLVTAGQAHLLEHFSDEVAKFEADTNTGGTLLSHAYQSHLRIAQIVVGKLPKGAYSNLLPDLAKTEAFWQLEALEYHIARGADIETRNSRGHTPLLEAIEANSTWVEETVRVLLKHGADPNAVVQTEFNFNRRSALELSKSPAVTKLLLEAGASWDHRPGLLGRVIARRMQPEIVTVLLDVGVDVNELPSPEPSPELEDSKQQQTKEEFRYALHEAARPTTDSYPPFDFETQQRAVVDLLLSRGADPLATYPDGGFVLQGVVEDRGHLASFLPLLSQPTCSRKGHHGRTLLVSACMPEVPVGPRKYSPRASPRLTVSVDAMHALLKAGADPLLVDDEGRTPLHWFCTLPAWFNETHRKAFAALVDHCPAAIHVTDKQGRKPLHVALLTYASRSQLAPFAIQHLLSAGADAHKPDPVTGNSILHFIAQRLVGPSPEATIAAALFRELVAAGHDINARNAAGETPAFTFAAAGWGFVEEPREDENATSWTTPPTTEHENSAGVLAEAGADFTAIDARGRTLLHVAAARDVPDNGNSNLWHVERAFKKLMELGADPRVEDEELRTAVDVAVARRLDGVVKLFTEEGKREAEREREEKERKEREKKEKKEKKEKGGDEEEGSDDDCVIM
ncbi:ankyrin repeat-containing domain protein [Staphylotrichum tortipilum]|uniref:Ankyrin repeat-containing domain protein n=1 Tax=Staphylotrichum tortipilum TaxID=2831512 RepID=A0AAN6MKG6_9PEZI|nr:ankyrin repeat-containing domain protein [Staphylotrichum longicolle]